MAKKLSAKAIKAKVGKIGNKAVVGYQIPIFSLSKIFDAGEAAAMSGASDDEIFSVMQSTAAQVALA